MKKVIRGHVYSTDTARKLANYSHGEPADFDHIEEALYRTKAGTYFLHGQGGPLTKYAAESVAGSAPGEKIIPLTEEQAKAWATGTLGESECNRIFGIAQETAILSVRVSKEFFRAFNSMKAEKDMTARELLEYLLDTAEEK